MEKDLMNELNDIFEEVKDTDASYERIEDGEYLAVLSDVIVGESKAGKPMLTLVFEITTGPREGRQHRKFFMLSGTDEKQLKQNLQRYATEVRKIGIDTSKGLNSTFDQLMLRVDDEFKLTIKSTLNKNGSEWVNTSFEAVE